MAAPLGAQAAADVTEVGGIKYDNTTVLGGMKLRLNGAGVRYKAIFKVYTAGLYLPGKASTPEAVIAATGPRRMHIVMLREINAEELGKLFTRGMEQNASRDEFSKVIPGVIKMGEIFAARKRLLAGDYFSIDYVPGVGSTIIVNGKPASEPIKEPEFFNALMKIWLGQAPADAQLKDALLGKVSAPKDPYN
ncbi:MAG TPA: chalcone isomerase family protein [Albitalea sp.]|nr:chalcone isomerase family protein [Albitalea sp.]